jgi:hypothetical protein
MWYGGGGAINRYKNKSKDVAQMNKCEKENDDGAWHAPENIYPL